MPPPLAPSGGVQLYLTFCYADRSPEPLGKARSVISLKLSAFILLRLGPQIVRDSVYELGVGMSLDAIEPPNA
jgi:multiple antibiotic resistance protein